MKKDKIKLLKKNNISILNWSTFNKKKCVLILGGGPSISNSSDILNKYIAYNSPVVLASNYSHNVTVDYTVFLDQDFFDKQYDKLTTNFIVGKKIQIEKKCYEHIKSKTTVINDGDNDSIKINIDSKGAITNKLPTVGFASILISLFFNPETIMIAGFDGPSIDNKYYHFSSDYKRLSEVKYNYYSIERYKKRLEYLKSLLIFIKQKNIKIFSTSNDILWRINKNKFGVVDFEQRI